MKEELNGPRRPKRVAPKLLLCVLAVTLSIQAPTNARDGRDNVVLVVIDTLRADRFWALAGNADRAPYLSLQLSRSRAFTDVHAASSWTATSTASLFTSLYPSKHQVRRGLMRVHRGEPRAAAKQEVDRLPADVPSLPQVLRAAGYRTFGFTDNVNSGRRLGFDRGFDHFEESMYEGAGALTRKVLRHRARLRAAGPTFLYLHFMDPHAPYHRRAGHRRAQDARPHAAARARYDSEVLYVDRQLARLHRALGWDDNTIVIITSDHGEAFGEHGYTGHPNQLHGELLQVPLLIRSARVSPGKDDRLASLVDILPTLRQLLGLPSEASDAGRSLLEPPRARRHVYATRWSETVDPPLTRHAVLTKQHKLIVSLPSEHRELFDRAADPKEQNDLARHRPQALRTLELRLRHLWQGAGSRERNRRRVEADAELMRRLGALGYTR